MKREYIKQLYPRKSDSERWLYKVKEDELSPDASDVFKIYCLISEMLHKNRDENELKLDFYSTKEDEIKSFLKVISEKSLYGTTEYVVNQEILNLEIDLVKGSIYKIKKYFLENNNIKDIRGGSVIIDYLNNQFVEESICKLGYSKNNIVYIGGGNIVIIVPKGEGIKICEYFENEFTKIALTVRNAFETISTTMKEFAFNFSGVLESLNSKLTERTKIKLYNLEFNNDIKKIDINGEVIELSNYIEKLKDEDKIVCNLCNFRNAKYMITEQGETKVVCPSCLRKHLVGAEKSIFFDQYEKFTGISMESKPNGLDDIDDEIAVIYGDGNNMGKIIMEIENVFEMMYFSRRVDEVTKKAVYESIRESMGDKAKFEVIALGGDDIFIIVPAKHAFEISQKIIDKFDDEFNNDITMSVGVVISKNNTPISSLFKIAQQRLKSAKKLLKKEETIKEGTIDITELVGGMHIGSNKGNKLFPLSNSEFKRITNKIIEFTSEGERKTMLHKINYAQKNMMKEEFELFYYYQQSKIEKGQNVDSLIKEICNHEERCKPYEISWDDILLISDRGGK